MMLKGLDIEMIKARLADAFALDKSWNDIAMLFPEVDEKLYNEVVATISARLKKAEEQLTPNDIYRGLGLEVDLCGDGLLVKSVYKDSPALKLGICRGDVISEVNFKSLKNLSLKEAISNLRNSDYPQGTIITVNRNNQVMTLGYGLNVKPQVIDNKRKYPVNFSALLIGARLMGGFSKDINNDSNLKLAQKNKAYELVR